MSQANGAKPIFDFTKVSRQWDLAFQMSLTKSAKAILVLQTPMSEEANPEQQIAYYERMEKALSEIETISETQALLISQVLVDIPRSWLLVDAPEEIDWTKITSLDYVQSERYGDLLKMLQTGEARLQAKNSPGTTHSHRKQKEA